jgi:RND family efflux transporter MFP subunit
MRKYLQILLPVAFLLLSVFVLTLLFLARPKATVHTVIDKLPVVSVVVAQARDMRIPVSARGRVIPFREQPLQAGSSGFVTYVTPSLVEGSGIRKGELLIVLNDFQVESRLQRAKVEELKAEQTLIQTVHESTRRDTNATARELVDAAEQSARLQEEAAHQNVVDLLNRKQHARITAPFDGWVMEEDVTEGMYVQPGMPLARLFAEDSVDIRVTLTDDQLELLDLPSLDPAAQDQVSTAEVSLLVNGKRFSWHGVVSGTEGRVDDLSRQPVIHLRIHHPYAPDPEQPGRPELRLGMLADVEIKGRLIPALYEIPRAAIHNGTQLWVVNGEDRLERRVVEILYKGRNSIYVTKGIRAGDRILMTQLHNAAEGLRVVVGGASHSPGDRKGATS